MKGKGTRAKYVIRARFTRGFPEHLIHLARGASAYLGRRGQWSSLAKALRFETRQAAEQALNEKWHKLRNAGTRGIILCVVEVCTE